MAHAAAEVAEVAYLLRFFFVWLAAAIPMPTAAAESAAIPKDDPDGSGGGVPLRIAAMTC